MEWLSQYKLNNIFLPLKRKVLSLGMQHWGCLVYAEKKIEQELGYATLGLACNFENMLVDRQNCTSTLLLVFVHNTELNSYTLALS